jgi:uncharacterized LabA/DUF88 family protein
MKRRVIIQVDGQNLFHSLKTIGIKEIEIDWNKLFHSFLDSNDELLRTYWYRPKRLTPSSYPEKAHLRDYLRSKNYAEHLIQEYTSFGKPPENLIEEIQHDYLDKQKWLKTQNERFSNIDYKYGLIAQEYSDLEIYKTGILRILPFKKEVVGEKGVDVALSVKMVEFTLTDKCDKIILLSGDLDYAEALTVVKSQMKKVHVVRLHKGIPPKVVSMSNELSAIADKVIDIYEEQLRNEFKK